MMKCRHLEIGRLSKEIKISTGLTESLGKWSEEVSALGSISLSHQAWLNLFARAAQHSSTDISTENMC